MIIATTADNLYKELVKHILVYGVTELTRAGPALVLPTPTMFCLRNPTHRVVQNSVRNANHAFHISEAMWMLDGDNNGRHLDKYIHDFSSRFGETDGSIHDAYGRRWISHFGFNQIKEVVHILQNDKHSRQAVIGMWDPIVDLRAKTKTRPCNLQLLFRVNNGYLDMTVTNRSNDLIWGALGANIVHMTILQEVIASLIGIPLGRYYVISNNLHMYKIHEKMAEESLKFTPVHMTPEPIVTDRSCFFKEVSMWNKGLSGADYDYKNKWIVNTVGHVQQTFASAKNKDYATARENLSSIECPSWWMGMTNWITSGMKKANNEK